MRVVATYPLYVQRAAIVVSGEVNTVATAKLAWDMARERGDSSTSAVAWEIVTQLPTWVNVAVRDQLEAHRRDTPDSSFVLVWFGTDEEIESVAKNGDPLES